MRTSTGVAVGDRASGEGHIVCGRCRNCRAGRRHLCIRTKGIGVNRDGAFADYVVIPASNVWVQPDDLDPDLGAVFDPLGNATHTALSVADGRRGRRHHRCRTDRRHGRRASRATRAPATSSSPTLSDYRLALAEHAGADLVDQRDATRPRRRAWTHLGMKEGFDIGLEMSGAAPAVSDMIANMNHGGRVALLGLPHQSFDLDWGRVITHMITLKGIYGREMYDTWYAMSR